MRILGSTDFLGNPVGFFSDVSEGVQELVRDGSVGGLVLNVTHGLSNSTAKFAGLSIDLFFTFVTPNKTFDDRLFI